MAQCLEVVGEWWTMLIVRDALWGYSRFDEFQRRLGISRSVLGVRLERLVDHGIMVKIAYSSAPLRYEYRLSEIGRDLWPIVNAMRQWGDKYRAPMGPPVELMHLGCGEITTVIQVCGACGEPVNPGNVIASSTRSQRESIS